MFLINLLLALVPARLQPYAKAVVPVGVAAVAVASAWVVTGVFDTAELTVAITAAVGSLLTLLLPNRAPE